MSRQDIYTDRVPVLATGWTAVKPVHGCLAYAMLVTGGTILKRGFLPGGKSYLDEAAVVDAGGGKVQVAAANHGFVSGGEITITGSGETVDLDGTYTLTSGTTADVLEFTATYSAGTVPATAYATGYRDIQLPVGSPDREDYSLIGQRVDAEDTIFYAKAVTGTAYLEMEYRR